MKNNKKEKVIPREDYIPWDECFMRIANTIAERSKDPSTQAGAVVVDKNNVVVGLGYNGLPRGVKTNDFPWERNGEFLKTKYPYICHAEENAIYNANKSVKNCKIYCNLFPCNECAKVIIQTGIKEIIFESDKYHNDNPYVASRKLLDASGIKYHQYISNIYSNKENQKLDNKIILGLTGLIGSGKGSSAEYLIKKYKVDYFSFSNILLEIIREMGLKNIRENHQKLSTSLRNKFGQDIISQGILKKVMNSRKKIIVLEAIRRKEDLSSFSDFPTYLIYINGGSPKQRFERIKKREERNEDLTKSWEKFKKEGLKETEKSISGLLKLSDFVIDNTKSLKNLENNLDKMIGKIKNDFKSMFK